MLPHSNYGILTWGSTIKEHHHLHKLQKKAVRIITQSDYIAHTEPLCKQHRLIKLPNMFSLAVRITDYLIPLNNVWKCYYKPSANIFFGNETSFTANMCTT